MFPGLQVNHIIDVNFKGFSDLVDAIGCVYTDVDHRYYNNTAVTDYSSIDIQPGYQKLCGDNQAETGALAFVRFRHTDTDIVRNARQQDFLRWAKSQFNSLDAAVEPRQAAEDLRRQLADGRQPALDGRADQPVQPDRVLGGPHGQADPVPGDHRALHPQSCYVLANPGAEARAFHAVHDADQRPAPRPRRVAPPRRTSRARGRRLRGPRTCSPT